jgi:phage-related protein
VQMVIALRTRTVVVRCIRVLIGTLALSAVPVLVSAHHSSAMFDQSRSLTLKGAIKEFRWTNPHVLIQLLVEGSEGQQAEEWSIEMDSPESLARGGWRPDMLRTDDTVTLVIQPRRDNTNGGRYVSGAGPRGRLIDEPTPAPASDTVSPGVPNAPCPRVELTHVESRESSETRPVRLGGQAIFVHRNAITTTGDISEIKVAGDDAETAIQIKYKAEAAAKLLNATTDHDGLQLAFVVDDEVWLAFTWRGPYGIGPDGVQVSIQRGLARAEGLMASIRACTDTRTKPESGKP